MTTDDVMQGFVETRREDTVECYLHSVAEKSWELFTLSVTSSWIHRQLHGHESSLHCQLRRHEYIASCTNWSTNNKYCIVNSNQFKVITK